VTLGAKTSTTVEIEGEALRDGMRLLTDPEGKLSDGQQPPSGGIRSGSMDFMFLYPLLGEPLYL